MDLQSLQNQSVGELVKLAAKLKDELFQLKFQQATQQLKTPHKLGEIKREIARVKMVTTMKRKALPVVAKAPKAPAPKAVKKEKPAAEPKKAAKKKGA